MKLARGPCTATTSPRCGAAAPVLNLRARSMPRRAHCMRVQATQQPSVEQKSLQNEERWDAQVKEGKVRSVQGHDIPNLVKDSWVILDVRPPSEVAKARIAGATEVPLFVEDTEMSLSSMIKRLSAFGMGGWWLGGTHMMPNPDFIAQVEAKVPKGSKVLVGCQKGLRSLAACEQLSMAGYDTIGWVNGGFDTCKPGELKTVGDVDIRYAGIGGLSEAIGWTEVQQEQKKGLGSADTVIKLFALILLLDGLLFAYEYINAVVLKTPVA